MLSSLSTKIRERIFLALLTIVALLRFYNLGFIDLQAWDEALYAVRAESILRFGFWVDQTNGAIGGLYSSLHPPLAVWLTSLSFFLFDVNEFSARFVSTLFGGFTLFIIYRIGKKISSPEVGALAALLFGLHPFVAFYARQGQFDTPLTFFLALAILFLVGSKRQIHFILSGVATGCALMTKLFVGAGIPLVAVVAFVTQRSSRQHFPWKQTLLMIFVALVVALPWHWYMTLLHGNGDSLFFLKSSALIERTISGVEGNIKPLEVFFFVNQLIVLFPFGLVWFLVGLYQSLKSPEKDWRLIGVWFVVFFLSFSIIRTKLAVYALPMLVPASLLAAHTLWDSIRGFVPAKRLALFVGGTLLSILWASHQAWRDSFKTFLTSIGSFQFPSNAVAYDMLILLFFSTLIVAIVFFLTRNNRLDRLRSSLVLWLFVPLFLWSSFHIFVLDRQQYNDGATALAYFLRHEMVEDLLVAGYDHNPQLTYYLRGADLGWRDDLRISRIIPPNDSTLFRRWLLEETMNKSPNTLLILEKDKFIRYYVIDPHAIAPPDYELVFDSRRYTVFKRTHFQHFVLR